MHRVNDMLKDEVWSSLRDLPKGERSQFINEALVLSFSLRRRQQATLRLQQLRRLMPPVSVNLTDAVRELRDMH